MSYRKVINTPSERLAYVLKEINMSERAFATKAGVTSVAVNNAIKRNKLSEKLLRKAIELLPVNEQWLRYGVGEMLNREQLMLLGEPEVAYRSRNHAEVRFERFIRNYATERALELGDVAKKMQVDYNLLIKTINGHRDLDCELMEAAVLYLGADANDIIAGVQFVPKALREAEQRIADLEALVAALRENNELLKRNAANKAT